MPRGVAAGVLVAVAALVAFVLLAGGGKYTVAAEFVNGAQLVEGSPVRVSGADVGEVEDVRLTDDGLALVRFSVDDEYAPLRRGTQVIIRPTSLSGIVNRYVDLQLGPDDGDEIEDGGRLGTDETQSVVEVDQVFNVFDSRTRAAVQDFAEGSADMLRGRGLELNRAVKYLNPSLSTGARLFEELLTTSRSSSGSWSTPRAS